MKSLQVTDDDDAGGGGGGDYVQLIELGTVVIFFVKVHVKSFFVNDRAFRSHPLIPVSWLMTLFSKNNTSSYRLMVFWKITIDGHCDVMISDLK